MYSATGVFCTILTLLINMSGISVVYAETQVHQQGNSTAVIEQEGGTGKSVTDVIKTPQGQKIITRDGRNTDITIQNSGGGGAKSTPDWKNRDRFAQAPWDDSDWDDSDWPVPSSSPLRARGQEIPTKEEFKARIRSRMRPLLPERD